MSAIDFFGNTVNRNFRKRPRFTRRFLRFGYAVQQLRLRRVRGDRRLPSQIFLEQMSMRAMRRALARPQETAIVNMFAPAELLHAAGVSTLCAEGFSSYLSGGKCERGYIGYASEKGVPETFCSYHRALIGAALAGLIQKPRFIITSSSVCDANTSTFRTIAGHFGMQEYYIDVPHEESAKNVSYVKNQLEGLALHIGEGVGRKIGEDALRTAVRNSNESLRYQRKFIIELARRHFPNYLSAEMHRILAGHNMLGSGEALAFFRMQYEDILKCPVIKERKSGKASPKRILWCHVLPYYSEALKAAFNHSDEHHLLLSDLNFDYLEPLDDDDALGSMARRLIRNHFNGGMARRTKSVTDMAQKLGADGAVIFCHWGCKHSNGGAFLLRDALTAAGFKTLVIDGDACDRSGTNEGQLSTRLQAFFEILDS
jgi:benzoyl-CoA reductase/2-hydroxyglutaryl-CoA dehydratase subunit BcrC/BadD/HgdB